MATKPTKRPKSATTKKSASVAKSGSGSVGQVLKAERLTRGLSLKEVELATRIRGKYLVAIEADRYDELPHSVYSRGFIRSFGDYLELDGASLADRFVRQLDQGDHSRKRSRRRPLIRPQLILTPRLLTAVGAIIAGCFIAVYLVLQVSALTAPPTLRVSNPARDQVLYGSLITVSGSVNDGADVYVNNSPILVDGSGNFSDAIALQNGVNSIQITAKNSLGKATTVTRNILAHVPATDLASQLPTQPISGVAVNIQVQDRTTTITVLVDGKQQFRGTMLPNTSLVFKGQSSVVVSTTDGAATHATITNSQVAGKDLGSLGNSRSPQPDLEFDRDTQFQ